MSGFDSSDDETDIVYTESPLVIDWFDLQPYGLSGQLGITSLPGCCFKGKYRNLQSDIKSLKLLGIRDAFVLLTVTEFKYYRVPTLLDELTKAEINVHHFPMDDGTAPTREQVQHILAELRNCNTDEKQQSTLMFCFGGLGRSCTVLAGLLLELDPEMTVEEAIAKVRELRGVRAIQSVKQYNFVQEYKSYHADAGIDNRAVSR